MTARIFQIALAGLLLCMAEGPRPVRAQELKPELEAEGDVARVASVDSTMSPRSRRSRTRSSSKKAPSAAVPGSYRRLRDGWHEPASNTIGAASSRALVFRVVGKSEAFVLIPDTDEGGFGEEALAIAQRAFDADRAAVTIHPRLLDLIYQAVLHFDAPYVNLISAYRRDRKGSRHSHGLAADIVLPGVNDEELAAFFRPMGFVGVGTYPHSGFVHVDVREKSYFWVDNAAPGGRPRMHQVRAAESKAYDEAAIARGESAHQNPSNLQRVLNARASRRAKRNHTGSETIKSL